MILKLKDEELKNKNRVVYLIFFLFIASGALSNENKSTFEFSNTLFYEFHSTMLKNPSTIEHENLIKDSSSYINEKFQSFIHPDKLTGFFGGVNVVAVRNEIYAQKIGLEFQFGFGETKNPFFMFVYNITYEKDLIFNNKKKYNGGGFFYIGHYNDLHFFIGADGYIDGPRDLTSRVSLEMDAALGDRKFLPIFFRFNFDGKENYASSSQPNFDFYHAYAKLFFHFQYYGDTIDISFGYSYYYESYNYYEYDAKDNLLNSLTISEAKYHGVGVTINKKNLYNNDVWIFGELHALANKSNSQKYMWISKFGLKTFF